VSTAMTAAPSAAHPTAWLRPWPRAAPVPNATLAWNRPMSHSSQVLPERDEALDLALVVEGDVGEEHPGLAVVDAHLALGEPLVAADALDLDDVVGVALAALVPELADGGQALDALGAARGERSLAGHVRGPNVDGVVGEHGGRGDEVRRVHAGEVLLHRGRLVG